MKKFLCLSLALILMATTGLTALASDATDAMDAAIERYENATLALQGLLDEDTGELAATEAEVDAAFDDLLDSYTALRDAYQALSEDEQAEYIDYAPLDESMDALYLAYMDVFKAFLLAGADDEDALADMVTYSEVIFFVAILSEMSPDDLDDFDEEDLEYFQEMLNMFDGLSGDLKALLDGLDIDALLAPFIEKMAQLSVDPDQEAADAVIALIDAIGTVSKDSADAIDAAREAYNALTDAQQALVTNYAVLTAAEAAYEALPADTTTTASTSTTTAREVAGVNSPSTGVNAPLAVIAIAAMGLAAIVLAKKKSRA